MNERLGIIGGGTIACGLAAVASKHGEVVLWARTPEKAQKGIDKVCSKLEIDPSNVRITDDLSALSNATIVVEAIAEDLEAKRALYADLPTSNGTLLATTTSSLAVSDLAEAANRPGRFLGLHVFNPVPQMKLVELVFPEGTDEETKQRAFALCEALGKTAVEVPDVPGFVVNRLLFPYLFSAVRLMEETGMEPNDIDTCMKLGAGHPMGPLALLDYVGLDVALAIGQALGTDVPASLGALVGDGALGKKSRRGFYEYS